MWLHATETGVSSGLIDHLARMRTIPYLTPLKSDNNQLLQWANSAFAEYGTRLKQ